ncbi:MAG TPA: hypothetical protein PKI15_07550 [Candidatus Cloacimonadota bacterium]|nr:hypothetical protein [Candidatus Cloacimonadota bacterium]
MKEDARQSDKSLNELITTIILRDGLTVEEARQQYDDALEELRELIDDGEDVSDFCQDTFGLEADFLVQMLCDL